MTPLAFLLALAAPTSAGDLSALLARGDLVLIEDDRWHTLEYGINAATPIVEAQGLRARLQAIEPR